MAQNTLEVLKRTRLGKSGARYTRNQGLIPAIVYGRGSEPRAISVAPHDLKEALATDAKDNTLLELKIKDEDGKEGASTLTLVKDVQYDYLTGKPIHFDFYEVDKDQKIKVKVPIETVGRSAGVIEGGILDVVMRLLEIECLPSEIPNSIEVEVSDLNIGNSLHIKDLNLPEGIAATHDSGETVITISVPGAAKSELEEAEELAAAEEAAELAATEEGEETGGEETEAE